MFDTARQAYLESIYQPLDIYGDQWADENRYLPKGESPEHGPWRTDRVPYMREIAECLSPASPVREIDFLKGTQIAGSEIGFNAIGHWIDTEPGNILFVQPSVDMVRKTAKTRFRSLIENTPSLSAKILVERDGDQRNTITEKIFPGGFMHMNTALSSGGARSFSYRYLVMDELDEYPVDLKGNGDPVYTFKRRTNTYRLNRKIYRNSSPKRKETSLIYREFLLGDQRLYYVPCMSCGHMAPLKWERIKWVDNDPKTVYCICHHCGYHIDESEKNEFLPLGKWKPHAECSPQRRSYQLPGLYSPYGWYSWEEAVDDFYKSKGDSTKIQVFANTVLAEPYEETRKTLKTVDLYNRREVYDAEVPSGVIEITAAVDVQKNRFEIEVLGWGEGEQSWQIEYVRLSASPLQADEFKKLDAILEKQYRNKSGRIFSITITLIDSGYATDNVYKYCSKSPFRLIPIKGSSNARDPIQMFPRKPYKNKGVYLTFLGTDTIKDLVFFRLQETIEAETNDAPGLCHWPIQDSTDQEYFKQLGNEEAVLSYKKGVKVITYQPVSPGVAVEALDVRVYNTAAIRILQENYGVLLKKPEEDPEKRDEMQDDDLLPEPTQAEGLLF